MLSARTMVRAIGLRPETSSGESKGTSVSQRMLMEVASSDTASGRGSGAPSLPRGVIPGAEAAGAKE